MIQICFYTVFLEGMKEKNLAGDSLEKYRHWEWTQGVGLYPLLQSVRYFICNKN